MNTGESGVESRKSRPPQLSPPTHHFRKNTMSEWEHDFGFDDEDTHA